MQKKIRTRSKYQKKQILIVFIIGIVLISLVVIFARYITESVNQYFLRSKEFYFESDKLSEEGTTLQVDNWSGVDDYTITINMNSRKNNIEAATYDISYDIQYSCTDNAICHLNKTEVREIASKYNLITARKKDSTGICFIGERNMTKFLENYLPNQEGDIVDIETNKIIGKHIGLMYYTIGQRRGLNIGGYEDRMFVVGKDLNKNILYISLGNSEYLYSDSCIVTDINWLGDKKINKCTAKFRYRQPDNEVELEFIDDYILVKYPQKVKAVTPGQACVFYLNEQCLGGGIIKEVRKNNKKLWYI